MINWIKKNVNEIIIRSYFILPCKNELKMQIQKIQIINICTRIYVRDQLSG